MEVVQRMLGDPVEHRRLVSLPAGGSLETRPEEGFDRIIRLTKQFFGVPMAWVSLVDLDRPRCTSLNLETVGTSELGSAGALAIADGGDVLVVPDTLHDERFTGDTVVVTLPHARFYAEAVVGGPDGKAIGALCLMDRVPRRFDDSAISVLRDFADLVERELAARHLATVDDLTGLMNRRGFGSAGRQLLAYADRANLDVTLLYVDSDGLKPLNDRWGHGTGDAALRLVADQLRVALRDADVVARIGGDEFAALLLGSTESGATSAAERFTRNLRAAPLVLPDGSSIELSATVGVGHRQPGGGDLAALTAEADRAMYQAKLRRRAKQAGPPVRASRATSHPRSLGHVVGATGRSPSILGRWRTSAALRSTNRFAARTSGRGVTD